MLGWAHVGAAAAASGAVVLLLVALIWRLCFFNYKLGAAPNSGGGGAAGEAERLKSRTGFSKLSPHGNKPYRKTNYPASRRDDVTSGRSGFGMTSSPAIRGSEVEMKWEISHGSDDFVQRIGFKKGAVVRTALPLPGRQEAYFEITVLYSGDDGAEGCVGKIKESEGAKLMEQSPNPNANSESLVHIESEPKIGIGLTGGGSLPLKLPGTYPGSVGFNSNGSIFLDGTKLVFKSEKTEWGRKDQVIGCGFDPRNKKVMFTIDSELVHVFRCQPEEYGAPMYPTLASNCEITVLVNFGQSAFKYSPANSQRTRNRCFAASSSDSEELFSMSRICSHKNGELGEDFDVESEADLFEIVLDKSTK